MHRLKLFRGAWYVVWNDGGTRRAALRTTDRAVAERRFADYLKNLERKSETVGEIVGAYLKEKSAASSAASMEYAWKALKPTFANLRPDQVSRALCQNYTSKRARAAGTIAKELGFLRSALRWHDKNTPAVIEIPTVPSSKERHLTRKEYDQLLAACEAPHIRLFVVLALATAARTQAILDLTWDRVDFEKGQIDLRIPGSQRRKGRAVVPMNQRARAALEEAYEGRTTDYVIEYGEGKVKRIAKGFRAATTRAGLKGVTPHTLRHTSAVWLAEAGVPMVQIAQYLGHDSARTTEIHYARFAPDHLADAAKALDG